MKSTRRNAVLITFLVLALGAGFAVGRAYSSEPADSAPAAVSTAAPARASIAPVLAETPDFRTVAKDVIPSVVTVRSRRTVKVSEQLGPQGQDPFGDELFRHFFGIPGHNNPGAQQYQEHGLGSGVVVSSDGYILTNNHVVQGVDQVEVVTEDGESHDAKIVGTDPETDLAVLKVDVKGLKPIQIGNSDALQVGEWVLAVGNPFSEALGHTVTAGIVSAKGRSNLQLEDYEDFIQTDAAINPGNSGGALVNTRGQLVGINTAIISGSGGSQGIGFAIPVNMAKSVMKQLIATGKVTRGWLGVAIQTLSPDLAEGMGIPNEHGAVVSEVESGTPAESAGLKRGDAIVKMDGQPVQDSEDLRNRIASTTPGAEVTLGIVRNGDHRDVKVKLGEKKQEGEENGSSGGPAEGAGRLGISVQTLTPGIAQQLGYDDDSGVVISKVEPGSVAENAGLRRGDLIKEVNRKSVSNLSEFKDALGELKKGKVVLLLVRRGDNTIYIPLKP